VVVKQHFVTAGYLAGFTLAGSRHSPFYVHSLDGSAVREDIPDHVAFERHDHTVDIPGYAPDHLESIFGEIEGPACALFQRLSANPGRPFACAEELTTALWFLAIQAARVPQSKAKYERLIRENGQRFMQEVAYSQGFFQKVVSSATRFGLLDGPVEQSSLRTAVESGEIKVVVDKTHVAVGMLRLADAIVDKLEGTRWNLLYSEGPDWFVCSDHPVGLFYEVSSNFLEDPATVDAPEVRFLNNSIYMPLAKNVALCSVGTADTGTAYRADNRMVGVVNCLAIAQAKRHVFSPAGEFVCRLPGGQLGNAAETMGRLRSLRRGSGN
jgi:hypothetical protein